MTVVSKIQFCVQPVIIAFLNGVYWSTYVHTYTHTHVSVVNRSEWIVNGEAIVVEE